MKFYLFKFQKTIFQTTIEKGNMDIVQLLLNCENIDVNVILI